MIENTRLWSLIEQSESILIAGHVNPDGDAIGACLAMQQALGKIGKSAAVLLEPTGEKYSFLPGIETVEQEASGVQPPDLFIALDCGDEERLGEARPLFQKAPGTINIDHHVSNTEYAQHNLVLDVSSTSEIIYELIKSWNIELDACIAANIYAGIIYDTGGFKHSNTTARTHEIAGDLIKYNIPFSEIHRKLFDSRSFVSAKLMGQAFKNLFYLPDQRVAISHLSAEEIQQWTDDAKQLDGIINGIKDIQDVSVAVFCYEKSVGEVKIGLRSDGLVDVSKVAVQFGGGGHQKASGCSFQGSLQEAKEQIGKAIQDALLNGV